MRCHRVVTLPINYLFPIIYNHNLLFQKMKKKSSLSEVYLGIRHDRLANIALKLEPSCCSLGQELMSII